MTRYLSCLIIAIALIGAATVVPMPAQAQQLTQSKAVAPVLDDGLKGTIQAMDVMNHAAMPALQDQALVVAFFASWCPPCRPEFGELNTLRAAFPEQDLAIIAINIFEGHFEDGNGARMKRFLVATNPAFTVLKPGSEADTKRLFGGVDRIPTVFIYDRAGQPVHSFIHQKGATKMHATAAEIMPFVQTALSPAS